MATFTLSLQAKTDLLSIGRYTQKTWGKIQRNRYLHLLDDSFQRLAQTPEIGQRCDDIRAGYWKYRVGRHLIFFRKKSDAAIEIVRILHGRMDIESAL